MKPIIKVSAALICICLLQIAFPTNTKAQSGNCSLMCNITQSYICPGSSQWKANASLYTDASLMQELGYVKGNDGCWKLSGSKTKTITGSKSYLANLYNRLKGAFSVKKKGF